MNRNHLRSAACILSLMAGLAASVRGQLTDTSFTYQGELMDAAVPADGAYDFQFSLWTLSSGGTQIGGTEELASQLVTAGRFTVTLNAAATFGASAFDGQKRWLEIAVRPAGSEGVFVPLNPRQALTASPYAAHALNAGTLAGQPSSYYRNAGNLTGTVPDASLSANVARLNAPNVFSSAANQFSGIGAGLTQLSATNVATGTLADARLSSNVALKNAANAFTGSNVFSATTIFNGGVGIGGPLNTAFRMQVAGGSGAWRGGLAAGGTSNAAVMGELAGVATIGGHNGALSAWSNLAINPVGGLVGIGTTTPQTTLHVAGQDGAFEALRDGVHLGRDFLGRARIELVNSGSFGPYLDFMNDNLSDFDARLELAADDSMLLSGASLQVAQGTAAGAGFGGYIMTGNLNGLNLGLDDSNIVARNNGAVSTLGLNPSGNARVGTLVFSDATTLATAPTKSVTRSVIAFDVPIGGSNTITVNVSGATVGDAVIVTPSTALEDYDVIAFARVSSAGIVQFRVQNCNQGLFDSGSSYPAQTWRFTLIK